MTAAAILASLTPARRAGVRAAAKLDGITPEALVERRIAYVKGLIVRGIVRKPTSQEHS